MDAPVDPPLKAPFPQRPGSRIGDMDADIKPITGPSSSSVASRPTPPLPHPGHTDSPPPKPKIPTHATGPKVKSGTPKPVTPTPRPGDAAAGPPSGPKSPEAGRPLNVTDALSYLDAVKVQFQDKPEVYNRFLDIMKDFKSQVIDTPGVISRVSRLFHGNPTLIGGFNTFLPVGYRIDVSADPLDPNTITVTTPQGTTTQSTNNFGIARIQPPRDIPGFGPNLAHPLPYPPGIPPPLLPPLGSRSMTPQAYHLSHVPPQFDPNFSPGFHQNTQTNAAASLLGNLNNKNAVEKQPPGEFNHAIQYLNKIKAKYSDVPNTYKQFLDILQTYQKEQKHTQEVYSQVRVLFKDAPALLAEFKDFLPEVVPQNGMVIVPQPSGSQTMPASQAWNTPDASSSSPDKVVKKPGQPLKRKKRVAEKDTTPVPPTKIAPTRTLGHPHSPRTWARHRLNPAHAHGHVHPPNAQLPPPPVPHSHPMQPPISTHPISMPSAPASADRLLFFDRAKKALESREIYEEFLKLLKVFSNEVIDVKTLIDRSRAFLGDGDLMAEFKELVGWDPRQDNVENGPPGSIRTGPPEALSALLVDDGEGPSYRKLPDSEVRLACSGRDELCRSVLNDEWVSHPTWASEEAGFQTHKKNSFEEALHKSEEERHEYHVQLQALTATISVLEPLCARIEEMSSEDRSSFRLKPNLGGSGRCLYERIIKKIYGRDHGIEIMRALQENPGVAVPVVLTRLKLKDEEWRRAQREWSRTWREVDSKNFYKSLDHQGISFKANDKKNITAKHFVADIEAIKAQQTAAGSQDLIPTFAKGSVGPQLEYSFEDTVVLHDALKMIFSFLDRSQGQYSQPERRSVEKFLRTFVPVLCMYPLAEFNDACGPPDGILDDAHEHGDGSRGGRRSTGSVYSVYSNGIVAEDLRKKLLRTVQERTSTGNPRGSMSAVGSRAPSPASGRRSPSVRQDEQINRVPPEDIWIRETAATGLASDHIANGGESDRPFFANTTFYTLLRLLQLLYSRLLMCKEVGQQLIADKHAQLKANPVAVQLGLDDPNGPATLLTQTQDVLNAREDANVAYMYLLDACDKVFSGELDQITFEEHMRWFFGKKAYHLFTMDKLITALVKQVQTIIGDVKCQELWSLLQSAQHTNSITNQDVIRYRREAERHVGQDDHLYRIQWVRGTKMIRVQLMAAEDPSVEDGKDAVSRWREYVNTYVMRHPTEWIPMDKETSNRMFLARSIRHSADGTAVSGEGMLSVRISIPTYKIVYEGGSEEALFACSMSSSLIERARAREEERRKSPWLQ
ncbi:histone deacetylase complex, SIN3 component [Desarmillaria tabescens]|uniref:Histone deacetylase complex, SIN3 component n=1 Tax=Armillaria tabescens TaxID=1929756 RepID=A0AA39T576_ARMTA|nr:histone deacetylase complex, SIN3 component [Desarmillaria tabescens]KAK0465461.1 histone deacetylase complex, SIN3 component [Desarmillaria tabescens]